MNRLIKKILKEEEDEKIINILKSKGIHKFDYLDVYATLSSFGYESDEIGRIYKKYSGIVGEPEIYVDDDSVEYVINLENGEILSISGHMDSDHDGRDVFYTFEPGSFLDRDSEDFFDLNWEDVSQQIEDFYYMRKG